MIDIKVYLQNSQTTIIALMVKNALIRVTDRNTDNGKIPLSGNVFFYQDYEIREPELPLFEGTRVVYNLRGFQDGYGLKDTLLSGLNNGTSQAAHQTFTDFVTTGGATVGAKDTTGNAATTVKVGYNNELLYDKLKDLANLVAMYVQFRRNRTTVARVVDFLLTGSAIAPRPDGTTGFKTSDPSGGVDTTRTLDWYSGIAGFSKLDESEAVYGQAVVIGRGTGSGQATGTSGSGRAVVIPNQGVQDDATAAAIAALQQNNNPSPRSQFDMIVPKLWTGVFQAILGDTIAITDSSGIHLTSPVVGQFIRWEYRGSSGRMNIYINRTRYYDDEVTKQRIRQLEQAQRNNQGAQNWNSMPVSDNADSTRPLTIPFYIQTTNAKNLKASVNIRGETSHSDALASAFNTSSSLGVAQGVTTLETSLPDSPYGYILVLAVAPGAGSTTFPAIAEASIAFEIRNAGDNGPDSTIALDQTNTSVWTDGTAEVLRIMTAEAKSGRKVKVNITNLYPSGQLWDLSWQFFKILPSPTGGTPLGASVSADVYIDVIDAGHKIATVSVPTSGNVEQVITIGSGTNQLAALATGQHFIYVVPASACFLAGQVHVQSQVVV